VAASRQTSANVGWLALLSLLWFGGTRLSRPQLEHERDWLDEPESLLFCLAEKREKMCLLLYANARAAVRQTYARPSSLALAHGLSVWFRMPPHQPVELSAAA